MHHECDMLEPVNLALDVKSLGAIGCEPERGHLITGRIVGLDDDRDEEVASLVPAEQTQVTSLGWGEGHDDAHDVDDVHDDVMALEPSGKLAINASKGPAPSNRSVTWSLVRYQLMNAIFSASVSM